MKTVMRIAKTAAAVALALAVAGCGKEQPAAPTAPAAPAASAEPAMTAKSAAPPCKDNNTKASTCDASNVCTVSVSVQADGIVVNPYVLLVGDSERTIVWVLKEPGFEFTRADGPRNLKNQKTGSDADVPANFVDGTPAGRPDGSEPGERGRHYKLTFKNATAGQTWSYVIQLRRSKSDDPGKGKGPEEPISCDPLINNQGG
jgi:hypothetical protein